MKLKKILSALPFLLVSALCPGQTNFNYTESFNIESGMSSNLVNGLFQDSRGFLWIATLNGLNRYDGKNIVSYFSDSSGSSLPDNFIYCICKKDEDHILLGTYNGISILDLNKFEFRTTYFDSIGDPTGYSNQIIHLSKDFLNNIWAATPSYIYRLDSNLKLLDTFHTQKKTEQYRGINVNKIIPLPTGDVLFWLFDGVYHWSSEGKKINRLRPDDSSGYSFLWESSFNSVGLLKDQYLVNVDNSRVTVFDVIKKKYYNDPAIFIDLQHRLLSIINTWDNTMAISTDHKGVTLYKLDLHGETPVFTRQSDQMMEDNLVEKFFCDNENNYWIFKFESDLIKVPSLKKLFSHKILFDAKNKDLSNQNLSAFLPHQGKILIGTYGNGYYEYDPVTETLKNFHLITAKIKEDIIWNFWQYKKDTIWIGTQQGLLWCKTRNHDTGRLQIPHPLILDSLPITTLYEDSHGRIWMGLGYGRGLAVYDKTDKRFRLFPNQPGGYPYRYPLSAGEDSNGNIWFISDATFNLTKWNNRTSGFEIIRIPEIENKKRYLSTGFYLDKAKDEIWYGVEPRGLINYRINDGTATLYGLKEGLSSAVIKSIFRDSSGRVWMGTTEGISCFDPQKGKTINFNRKDGLPAAYYSSPFYFDKELQRLFIGTQGILTWFNPHEITEDNHPLNIYLTGLLVNNTKVSLPENEPLSFGFKQNNITIQFSGINLTNGSENLYQYRLNETEWMDLGKQTEIHFANLKGGSYNLEIRASRKNGAYGAGKNILKFTIRPRFTSTIWFYLAFFIVIIAVSYSWYRYRLLQLKQVFKIRSGISRDLHDEVGSKLTNINLISQIIKREDDRNKKEVLLSKIQEESEDISQSMREIIWNIDPENDSLASAIPRMLSFASRILEAGNITVKDHISGIDKVRLNMEQRRDLFLIYKEAINNIVKHSGATRAEIRTFIQQNIFHLQITDFGKGFTPEQKNYKSGLRYMKQRAEKHHWLLDIKSNKGEGTLLSLSIKI